MANSNGMYNSSESSDTMDDEDQKPRYTVEPAAKLPFMPDDCLRAIMKYLGPVELHRLSRISDRMKFLISDKSLWKRIDFRPNKLTSSQLKEYLRYFNDSTVYIGIQGFICRSSGSQWKRRVITPYLLRAISMRCPMLETLVLEAMAFKLSLTNFPASLKHLSLKRTLVMGLDSRRSYFQGMHDILPNLKVLILSNCSWVSPHDFMSISKCPLLEELRMDGCPQLGECVAYTSLAARFGFPSLKILDLRNTRMCDSDVSCFSYTLTLAQLYLQGPAPDCDDRCCEPACVDLSYKDDYMDSTDDDDDERQLSSVISQSDSTHQNLSSLPLSPRQSKTEKDFSSHHISSLENESERKLENGDTELSQTSASHGTRYMHLNPAGPSPVRIGRKHNRAKKRPSGDSGSSSDDNSSESESNIINTVCTSDTETVGSGSLLPDKRKIGRISSKAKRPCSEANSILNNNIVPNPILRDPFSHAVAGCSTSEQRLMNWMPPSPPPNPVIIISSAPTSSSDGTSENGNDSQRLGFPMALNANNFFHRLDTGSPSESTITDVCVMSYVLEEIEADEIGYVRIVSPQSLNARSKLHTLLLRNYRMITDVSLQYLLKLCSLRYLDVSGTSVTEGGVLQFKLRRPDVHVVCDYNNLPV